MALKRDTKSHPRMFEWKTVRVGGRGQCVDYTGVDLDGALSSVDLGSSSKYSNEIFENRSGGGFHVNCFCT